MESWSLWWTVQFLLSLSLLFQIISMKIPCFSLTLSLFSLFTPCRCQNAFTMSSTERSVLFNEPGLKTSSRDLKKGGGTMICRLIIYEKDFPSFRASHFLTLVSRGERKRDGRTRRSEWKWSERETENDEFCNEMCNCAIAASPLSFVK